MDNIAWPKILLITWACGCALADYRQRRLPNSLTLGAAGAAIIYMLIHGRSILGATSLSAVAAGIGIVFLLSPCLWLGWLGAGDIKLMSAIGFIGGAEVLATTFVLSSLLALPVALWLSVGTANRPEQTPSRNLRLPQGVFIALGLILALFGNIGAHST